MKVDFEINDKTYEAKIEFAISELESPANIANAMALVTIVAADYELDPELEQADMLDLIEKAKVQSKPLSFLISEEGIEVDLEQDRITEIVGPLQISRERN